MRRDRLLNEAGWRRRFEFVFRATQLLIVRQYKCTSIGNRSLKWFGIYTSTDNFGTNVAKNALHVQENVCF